MKVKHGAVPFGVKAVMNKAWDFYVLLCEATGVEPVITDGVREPKAKYSLHEDGYAIDVRLRDLPVDQGKAFAKALQKYLGNDYDVIYYHSTFKHIHIEYQRHLDDKKEWQISDTSVKFVN